MERVHTEMVREPILRILQERKILSAKQIADELKAYYEKNGVPWASSEEEEKRFINSIKRVSLYVVLSSLEKEGLLTSVQARSAPVISTKCYWMFSKKEKVWMLSSEYQKYLENPDQWIIENEKIITRNCAS